MALLGSNPHKTWVFELCHLALFANPHKHWVFANSAKFSSQAVGRREGRSLLGEIDKF